MIKDKDSLSGLDRRGNIKGKGMTENQKAVTALVVGGIIGWLLHKGKVNLHFNPTYEDVQYDVLDVNGNPVVLPTHIASDTTLTPGDYTVNMKTYLVF